MPFYSGLKLAMKHCTSNTSINQKKKKAQQKCENTFGNNSKRLGNDSRGFARLMKFLVPNL